MNIDLIKAKVLDLAIKGQLVEQRDDEKLSDEILALPNIDGSFQIPANWKFVYLNNIGNFFSGKTPHKENLTEKEGIPYFKVSDMNTYGNEKYLNNTSLYINKTLKIKTYPAFSIVFPKNGGAVLTNKKRILAKDSIVDLNTGGFTSTKDFYLDFAYLYFLKFDFKNFIKGSVLPTLDMDKFKKTIIALPPIKEQHRIVKKIEEIFSILDALKDHQTSLLSKLDLIRKVAIDKAIKGQLVEQRDNETLSDEILNLPKIDGPFTIPNKWKWVTFNDIAILNPRNKIDDTLEVSFITMSDINAGYSNKFNQNISRWGNVKKGFTHFSEGDVLIAKITPCFQNRKSFVAKSLHNGFGAGTTELHVIRPNISLTNNLYLLWLCKSEYFIKLGTSLLSGSVGQQRISKNELSQIKVPLPPIQEQTRIVQKLEEILSTVSTIENLLKSDKT